MTCDTEYDELIENNGFKTFCSLTYEDTIKLDMYRSVNTGITVCIADVEGPLIHGSFNIATETFDNDGLPYAVARLILTGSEDNPTYRTLHYLAERSLTDIGVLSLTDSTCFTMTTAGSEGFLTILPIYLDQILYPALMDSAYLIEVHNVTSKGNAGELYCNAQSDELTTQYIIEKEMFDALYPGQCGCKSIIQGTTKNLRESTTNEKVKEFHKKFYWSRNLTILITGNIEHKKIFQALLPLEQKIRWKERQGHFIRPWQTPIEQLINNIDVNVNFPSTDERYGTVNVAWRGPSAVTQVYKYRGCCLLLSYLTMTEDILLKKDFGEKSELTCTFRTYEWSDTVLNIVFLNVPVRHLQLITKEFIVEVLNDIFSNGINMNTLNTIIHQAICQSKLDLEKDSHINLRTEVFKHIIHGNIFDETYDIDQSLNTIREFEKLKTEPKEFFLNLLETYFINAPVVIVRGKPSLEEYLKLQEEEELKTAEQIKKLSTNCLQQKENQLQLATTKKDVVFLPLEFLAKVPIPGTKSITFHYITRYNTETKEQHSKLDVKKLPLFTYLDDVKTNFVYLQVIMDTSSINTEYKNYLFLLMDVLKESSVKRDDKLISYDEIIAPLDIISIKFRGNTNNIGNHCHSMSLTLKVELKNYEDGVQFCKELLYNTELTAENLQISTARLLDISKQVEYIELLDVLMHIMLYKKDTFPFACTKLQQYNFFWVVKKRLNNEAEQKKVIAEIESVRKTITLPKNMFVHMAVNVDKLTEQVSDVYAPWNKFFSDFVKSERTKPNLIADWNLLKPFENHTFNGCVMGLESIDSPFFVQTCRCITDVRHLDLPALIVCLKYFTQKDGPMRQELVDATLSNTLFFCVSVDNGLLYLGFFPANNLVSAYTKAKEIVETYSTGIKWKQHLYEKAKSMAILDCINNVRSIKSMTKVSLKYSCNNVPFDYVYDDARRISTVTMEDLSRVTRTYIKPLFDPQKSKTAILCDISKINEIVKAFHQMNFNFKVYRSSEELNLNDGIY